MRNLVLTIVSVLAINTINAQQELIASADDLVFGKGIKLLDLMEYSELENEYSEEVEAFSFSSVILSLQKSIAEYDVTEDSVYDNSERATYNVTFEKKSSKARVTYNNEGEILKSVESYKNIRLPASLRIQIVGDNPLFSIDTNKVTIIYHKVFGVAITYKVTICNGKQRKTLKFDKDYNSI